ncbi:2OG-Fe dioxygenase family protein [Candidatus Fukatsuia symbiotica]|uniref:2OG-Fe dioxygenase family protein n=1 Tax=Candidatus Fukatsuia symbiotica TaxID=1878942 RepID=A0A2U8I5S2_9GAMM|nr:2OG-Fe dioxygenase family protein [Candidatus Fukatsuia symbiotica]AWK14490.1 hypothetical protein CCS41_08410 [Candidatus Fukatsuia symbiotica]MEA9444779.1 2OG-Fe dioxygenase family protein [Candidatus Fukatsuia symbiotica]
MVKEQLVKHGFANYHLDIDCEKKEKEEISAEFNMLALDNYAPENVARFRRYGSALLLPWFNEPEILWIPTIQDENGNHLSGYDQGNNNPEHGNMRYFHSLSKNIKNNHFLKKIIINNFNDTFNLKTHYLPIYIGVHFIKIECSDNTKPGISSPNCFHQDGEPFTFAHLISRKENTAGGINFIGKVSAKNKRLEEVDKQEILNEFTLHEFLDSFAVCDEAVSHYVSPIYKIKDSNGKAERCIILIDYSKTKQDI